MGRFPLGAGQNKTTGPSPRHPKAAFVPDPSTPVRFHRAWKEVLGFRPCRISKDGPDRSRLRSDTKPNSTNRKYQFHSFRPSEHTNGCDSSHRNMPLIRYSSYALYMTYRSLSPKHLFAVFSTKINTLKMVCTPSHSVLGYKPWRGFFFF